VENIVIIGGGFSALNTYLKFENFNPIIITTTGNISHNLNLKYRKNLNTNKLFSKKNNSFGSLNYYLKKNTKIHDRITLGGNSNIWGGFININSLNQNFINILEKKGLKFHKLNQKINGYLSNDIGMRQIRDNQGKILDVSKFLSNYIRGFVNKIEFLNKKIKIIYYSENSNKIESIYASKLFIAISLPQLLDLFFRSNMLTNEAQFKISEFEHKFSLSKSSKVTNISDQDSVIVKYDFKRAVRHFFGFQSSLDKYFFNLPIFVDQIYFSNKRFLNLKLNIEKQMITQLSSSKFGDSIHYCNLQINYDSASKYLQNFSKDINGVSMPFVNQIIPGPISTDIVNNIWQNY